MRHEDVREQLEYLAWVRDRVLAAAAALTDDEFRSSETVTTRDLRGTLAHQLECEWAWRIRLSEGMFPDGDVLAASFPTLATLADSWHREEVELRRWFDGRSEAELGAPPPGDGNPLPMWRYLLYVANHGTAQFAEAAVLLTRLGHSPGELGYLAFCSRPEAGRSA